MRPPEGFAADADPPYGHDCGPECQHFERRPTWMRVLDWIEARTSGPGTWPWAKIWLWRGVAFHFPSGAPTGFAVSIPLPRWLPGFVKPYQVDELRTRAGRRDSDVHLTIPLFPPGWPDAYRTRRLRGRA